MKMKMPAPQRPSTTNQMAAGIHTKAEPPKAETISPGVRLNQARTVYIKRLSGSDIPYTVARTTPRFAFIAEAEIVGMKDRARVSELSARGCYIDSINPLPKGTDVRLRIRYGAAGEQEHDEGEEETEKTGS